MLLYKTKPLSPLTERQGHQRELWGALTSFGRFMDGLQSHLEMISQQRYWTGGLNEITCVCPNPGCASPAPQAGTAEVMPGNGRRGSPWPIIPFFMRKENPTQPNPMLRHCLEQPSQINTTCFWQWARGPCLRKQAREAGNQLVGFVPTAANEEPSFSCQLPLGPPQVSPFSPVAALSPAAAGRVGGVLGICIV